MMLKSNTLHSSLLFSSLLMQCRSAAKAPFNLLKIQILLGSSLKATTTTGNLLFRYTSACSKTPSYKWRKKEMGKDDKTLWKMIPVWYHLIPRQSSLRIKWRAAKSPGYKRLKERKKENLGWLKTERNMAIEKLIPVWYHEVPGFWGPFLSPSASGACAW